MQKIEIFAAGQNDMPQITAIYQEAVRNGTASWEYDPPTIEEMQARFENIIAGGFPYIAAKIGDKIVGFAYASSYRTRIGYRFCVEDSVYVDPNFHGQGVGCQLLAALVSECCARGFKQMIAVIGDSQNQASIRLHEKCGFVIAGQLNKIGYKFDKWLDSILMQRELFR
ncbi:MAG: phosphinothricin acetyltransferase [Hyphomonadaceae bacterium]|nr:MAG: phosphinothricin acetyltransferase [Hyphomonadaceae bacterium]KAF0183484.1 MAG: phosphinothricin acetyltransferase [Hyphomonadaceae bacterium]